MFLTLSLRSSVTWSFLIAHYFSITYFFHDNLPFCYSLPLECCSDKDCSRRYCHTQHGQLGEPAFCYNLLKNTFQQESFQTCQKQNVLPFSLLTFGKSIPLNVPVRQTCLKSNHWRLWLICITQLAIYEYMPFHFLRVSFFLLNLSDTDKLKYLEGSLTLSFQSVILNDYKWKGLGHSNVLFSTEKTLQNADEAFDIRQRDHSHHEKQN